MDSKTIRNYKPEIVSPAGNPEKLKMAVAYGADAVYFGGSGFNLRDKAGNFSPVEISVALNFCIERNVKSVFLLNSYLHENEIRNAEDYINKIRAFPFNAVMVSDPGMIILLKEAGIESDLYLSTQMSTLNHLSIKFWNSVGIKRIVLARETTLDEIKMIRDSTDAELETFAHGALCVSYSGRCLLSRFLSGRDANRGSCSHPCRWKYALVEEKRQGNHMEIIEYAKGTEILSSKDLCLIDVLPDYVNAGINAFKIEGRMKSIYYTANTTRIYKQALNAILDNKPYDEFLPFFREELDLISHRPYTNDLFNEFNNLGFSGIPYIKKTMFLGYSLKNDSDKTEILIKVFNPVYPGDKIDIIYPIENYKIKDTSLTVEEIFDENGNGPEKLAQPGKIYSIKFDKEIDIYGILRKKLNK